MYALLHNNEIKVGPRDYHPAFFNKYFEDQGLSLKAPAYYEDKDTIVLDDNTKIVYVNEPVMENYNPITEQLAGPFWDSTKEPIDGFYTVTDRDLNAAKNDLKAKVAENRYAKECAGIIVNIQGQDITIDSNRDSRHIWFQSMILLPDDATQKFKFSTDSWLDLTKQDINTIVQALVSYVQSAYDWEATKIVEIDSANDKETIQTINVNWE